MAKPFSRILDQIERLQKEAAAIQTGVVDRIRKEIADYGLTPEHLFGAAPAGRKSAGKKTRTSTQGKAKSPKFADGAGNTWGGMGKRPDWIRQALDAGKALEDFLIGKPAKAAAAKKVASEKPSTKKPSTKKPGPARKPVTAAAEKSPAAAAKKKVGPAKKVAAKKVAVRKAAVEKAAVKKSAVKNAAVRKAAMPKRRQAKAASPAAQSAAS